VSLEAVARDGEAVLTVADRGRGLGGADGASLAARFGRGGNVRDVVGSGLGLAMVTEVARAYGGAFTLDDREGGGACARFSLPLG
jgi:two-component system sensor histidine kinase TctE